MAIKLDIDNQRRDEPRPDEPHYHVWLDTYPGLALLCQAPRFRTPQAARQAAHRNGYDKNRVHVMKCKLPCRFTCKRKRKSRARKTS